MKRVRAAWWGGRIHRTYTIIIFLVLASLDNSARAVTPPLYAVMARDLDVPEAALGISTASMILLVAVTALLWGFWGDRSSRKWLLMAGTLIWSSGMFASGMAAAFPQFFAAQLITAVGIGCIASVGFSIIIDLIPPGRRGLFLSVWGLSQTSGGGLGALAGSLLGASNWRVPFLLIAGAGFTCALLYLFTYEPFRGQSEPELARIFQAGERYKRRIKLSDLRQILGIRSNLLLIVQGLSSTIAFGALVWMPRLYIGRLQAQGYDLETATMVGSLLAILFQLGLFGAIPGGYWGDRWQKRNLAGRAWIGMLGSFSALPFLWMLFFAPLTDLTIPPDATLVATVWATITSLFINGQLMSVFLIALLGFALVALETPNRAALLSDLNQPEHRSTVAGMSTLLSSMGLALGNAMTGIAHGYLAVRFAPPLNYAVGLALFQLFFIPSGILFLWLTRTTPRDVARARQTLVRRSQQTADERAADEHVIAP